MGRFKDLTGIKFGKLSVIKKAGKKGIYYTWLCKCECGNEKVIIGAHLTSGNTKSCGCYKPKKTHGMSDTRIYNIWSKMKRRCYNPNDKKYKNYGGRGIRVCNEWKNSFIPFYEWAVNNGYQENLTIDRIDVDGNYEPSNCRWADNDIQAHNKQLDKLYTYNGKTMSIKDWCKEIGFYWTIFHK